MGKYRIEDFEIGDTVYHLSNKTFRMVIIEKYPHTNEVVCRWVNKSGDKQSDTFMAQELGKVSDLRSPMSVRALSI